MIVVDGGGSGMDLTVALPCVDGANPTFFGKLVFVNYIVVNGGDGGMEPTAPIIVIDHGDGGHCQLQQWLIAAAAMAVCVNDGCH
jgi:hypothetical protein